MKTYNVVLLLFFITTAFKGYAQLNEQCVVDLGIIPTQEQYCVNNTSLTFTPFVTDVSNNDAVVYVWRVIDPSGGISNFLGDQSNSSIDYSDFSMIGTYTISLRVVVNQIHFCTTQVQINVEDCDDDGDDGGDGGEGNPTPTPEKCDTCHSFRPIPTKKYVLSAWVKENHTTQQYTYEHAAINITFPFTTDPGHTFHASGDIIEGWQRIIGEFVVPLDATEITINLVNNGDTQAFYDDIRVHPFNGNMKSFVYDAKTQRLMAELDENNFATYYQYDKEGGLIRVKKETQEGVMTIQETRSGNAINN